MKLISNTTALFILIAGATMPAVQAHHSGAVYDRSKVVTIVGTVKAFNWVNPHVSIDILADGKEGGPATLWSIAASSPGVMSRSGWSKNTVKAGDRITLEFNPLRDGAFGGNISKATLPDGKSFSWSF